jgi:hypothetical protein
MKLSEALEIVLQLAKCGAAMPLFKTDKNREAVNMVEDYVGNYLLENVKENDEENED